MSAAAKMAELSLTGRAALGYAAAGLKIIPLHWIVDGHCSCLDGDTCDSPGKHPLTKHGLGDLTADPSVVRQWFTRWPQANIGLALKANGLIAFDIDKPENYVEMERLEAELGELPLGPEQKSGSGNEHRVVAADERPIKGIVNGITMRVRNYIVVEPSMHKSGNRYAWKEGRSIVEIAAPSLSAPWLALVRRPAAKKATNSTPLADYDKQVKRARSYLAKLPPAIQGQHGRTALFKACCWMIHGFHLDDSTARALIVEDYNPKCVPPFADWEVDEKIESAREDGDPDRWQVEDRPAPSNRSAEPERNEEPPDFDDVPPPDDKDAPHDVKPKRKAKGDGAVKTASKYVAERATHPDGVLLRRWRGDFYRWTAERGHYSALSADQIRADLYRKLGLGKRGDVGEVRDALVAVDDVLIDDAELGTWLDGRADDRNPHDLAACRNGILHLPDKTLIAATPRYFATTALGVDFNPSASPPRAWNAFLKQLWPNDEESITLLQEWIGYLLTPDTRHQKILLVLGPKRSGKGTIARVITALLGAASVASPTLASLGTNFGLWPLIGKTAAIIGDARLGGRSDIAQVVERLLSISGEDLQTIDRKHREPWTGKLATRITVISNEPPRFTDASDALACRMLVLQLERSFYGKEDTGLTDTLLAELPGILRWAIDGWARLHKRGHFVQPAASKDAIDELIDLASPVAAWARQCCKTDEPEPKWWLTCADAYEKFKAWADAQGHKQVATMTMFGRDVQTATGCRRVQVTRGEARPWTYRGLALL